MLPGEILLFSLIDTELSSWEKQGGIDDIRENRQERKAEPSHYFAPQWLLQGQNRVWWEQTDGYLLFLLHTVCFMFIHHLTYSFNSLMKQVQQLPTFRDWRRWNPTVLEPKLSDSKLALVTVSFSSTLPDWASFQVEVQTRAGAGGPSLARFPAGAAGLYWHHKPWDGSNFERSPNPFTLP